MNKIVDTMGETDFSSKVYVLTDERGVITRCEGGYTTPEDLTGWTEIDHGFGDKYNLCQSHYFPGGIFGPYNTYRYKLVDGAPVERTDDEQKADYVEPEYIPTEEEKLRADVDFLSVMTGIQL